MKVIFFLNEHFNVKGLFRLTVPNYAREYDHDGVQGWEFALSLFTHLLFALLLKMAHIKERLLVIHSHRSLKKSKQ